MTFFWLLLTRGQLNYRVGILPEDFRSNSCLINSIYQEVTPRLHIQTPNLSKTDTCKHIHIPNLSETYTCKHIHSRKPAESRLQSDFRHPECIRNALYVGLNLKT